MRKLTDPKNFQVSGSAPVLLRLFNITGLQILGLPAPLFALPSARLAMGGLAAFQDTKTETVAMGIILVVYRFIVVVVGTMLIVTKFGKADLEDGSNWVDSVGFATIGPYPLHSPTKPG